MTHYTSRDHLSLGFFSQAKDYIRLNEQIKIMREMFNQYEQTIQEKHQMETNLNKALDFLFNKTIADRRRVVRVEERCDELSLSLAKRFYQMKLKRVCIEDWRLVTIDILTVESIT